MYFQHLWFYTGFFSTSFWSHNDLNQIFLFFLFFFLLLSFKISIWTRRTPIWGKLRMIHNCESKGPKVKTNLSVTKKLDKMKYQLVIVLKTILNSFPLVNVSFSFRNYFWRSQKQKNTDADLLLLMLLLRFDCFKKKSKFHFCKTEIYHHSASQINVHSNNKKTKKKNDKNK